MVYLIFCYSSGLFNLSLFLHLKLIHMEQLDLECFSSLFDILVSVLLYIIMNLFGLKSTSLIVVLAIFHLLFVFFILYLSTYRLNTSYSFICLHCCFIIYIHAKYLAFTILNLIHQVKL